ncbi:PREDICTED: cholesterol 24-hydroxylase-like [Nanorana parkeri]|uniref:cholesterol 24-hydroxylase-like n=1 Tax=Nanorana parkeri TaxID=125878 RepID=UPI00085458CF|nr:PREDICTED: cholesterol 24-hydroxylase-like [Nanorana parkeri]
METYVKKFRMLAKLAICIRGVPRPGVTWSPDQVELKNTGNSYAPLAPSSDRNAMQRAFAQLYVGRKLYTSTSEGCNTLHAKQRGAVSRCLRMQCVIFLLGNIPTLMKAMKEDSLVHELFLRWSQTNGPVFRVYALHRVMILVTSPNAVKEILMSPKSTKDLVYKKAFYLFGERFLGAGLVTDRDYEHWHKQRRVMDPAFSRTYLTGMMGTFNEKAEELMEQLAGKADGKAEFAMHEMMNKVTLDVIAKVAFGMDLNSLHDDQTPFPQAISTVMRGLAETRNPLAEYSPGKRGFIRSVRDSVRLLRQTGKECIEKRQKAMQDGEEIPMDILSQILKGASFEKTCDMEILLDNFVTFFIAGQETTANQLSFAVMELARHPEILERVQAEVDDVIGSKIDIGYEDLSKLDYLSQVLKETLRLYPSAPGTSRLLEQEMVIEGHRVPPNVTLVFNFYSFGRMEQFFNDPLKFDPERFGPDAKRPYFTYLPFSLGPRSCIGQALSQMEAKVVMAKLLQRFEFKLAESQSFDIIDIGTLRPKDGVICRLRPRANK